MQLALESARPLQVRLDFRICSNNNDSNNIQGCQQAEEADVVRQTNSKGLTTPHLPRAPVSYAGGPAGGPAIEAKDTEHVNLYSLLITRVCAG